MNPFLREKLYFCKTIMATDKIIANVAHFPEETCADGIKVYGETSMDSCLAVLTHILHSDYELRHNLNADQIAGIKELVNDWLDAKGQNHGDFSNDDIVDMVEDPIQTELFKGFFDVPFPAPEHPKFTFIDLFAGIGGFRIAMQNLGENVFIALSSMRRLRKPILRTMARCRLVTLRKNQQRVTYQKNSIFYVLVSLVKLSHLQARDLALKTRQEERFSLRWKTYCAVTSQKLSFWKMSRVLQSMIKGVH